jgi:RNA polymerase-binding transcription factor
MRKTELAWFRRTLADQLAAIVQHGASTVHGLASEKDALTDPLDRAAREEDVREELRLRDRDRKLASKIEEALERIGNGTFGVCDGCGGAIDPARLRARPMTTLCIACKRAAEVAERN